MASAQVTASELFPFLATSSTQTQRSETKDPRPFASTGTGAATKGIQFSSLLTEDTEGRKIVYRQVCAQPKYERCHPYQLRMQLEFAQLYERSKAQVEALLEEKQQADRCRERQYRQLLFGISSS
jgi:hypothetical protein